MVQERLVDVLNERNTVLHVVPVATDDTVPDDAEVVEQALQTASHLQLVQETEIESLHARMHVCRGGPLTPVGDVVQVRQDQQKRNEDRIRTRAYFLWQRSGCPDDQAEAHWHEACLADPHNIA